MQARKLFGGDRQEIYVVVAIFMLGFLMRLYGVFAVPLIEDEYAHLAFAKAISLDPHDFHLVFRTADHPFLSAYVVRAGIGVFGEGLLGLRFFHAVFGSLTLVVVYLLAREGIGKRGALVAMLLLSVDQFHVTWSRVFMPEVLMLFFASLSLLLFWKGIEQGKERSMVLSGIALGCSYLAKEPGILLLPVFLVYLLLSRQDRTWFKKRGLYFLILMVVIIVLPDIVWSMTHASEGHVARGLAFVRSASGISFKSFSLYLGEIFRMARADILDDEVELDYLKGSVYCVHWVAGVLYLTGIIFTLRNLHKRYNKLLLTVFIFVFVFFTVVNTALKFDPFWWASMSMIPAVILSGRLLDTVMEKRLGLVLTVLLLLYLFGRYFYYIGLSPRL